MKKALIIIVLLVLCSSLAFALPFRLAVGKQGAKHLDVWGTGEHYFDLDLSDNVYVFNADFSAQKTAYRCGGFWKAYLFEDGKLVSEGNDMRICRGFDDHCYSNHVFNLEKADSAVVGLPGLVTRTNHQSCDFHIYGNVNFIEGKRIDSAIISKSEAVGFGRIQDILGDFEFKKSSGDYVVRSDEPKVIVWVGGAFDQVFETKTSRKTDEVWACYDGDKNNKCDFAEDSVNCLANGGDFYKGVCCGVDITDCDYVGFYNNEKIDAFCAQLDSGDWAWIAKENIGEIFDLNSGICPAKNFVADGNKYLSCDLEPSEYLILEGFGYSTPDDCSQGFQQVDYVEIESDQPFTIPGTKKYRVCAKNDVSAVIEDATVTTKYGSHEYLCSNDRFFECAPEQPFSTSNSADLGSNSRDLSALVCPIGLVAYWPFDGDTDNFVGIFANGVSNDVSFANSNIGMAAVFSTAYSDIEVSHSSLNKDFLELSLEAWIKPLDITGRRFIFHKDSFELFIEDGYLKASIYTAGSPGAAYLASSSPVSNNAWSHVVLTYDGENARLYHNAQQKDSQSLSGRVNASSQTFGIGARSVTPGEPFKGLIDEAAIYSRALDQALISSHYSNPSAYCQMSTFTEVYYCASDGDWTKDLDVKDDVSCHAAGFNWTGHKCCSEFDDPDESYSDSSSPAQLIDNIIVASNNANKSSEYEYLLEGINSFVTVTGLARFSVVRTSYRSIWGGDLEFCADEEVISFDISSDQSRKIKNKMYDDRTDCKIGKTKITSIPVLAAGGCFNKTFYPSGSFLHGKDLINYQGEFTACKQIPIGFTTYNFISNHETHCGEVLPDVTQDLHLVCLPDNVWHFTDDDRPTGFDDTLWNPEDFGLTNVYKNGCCPQGLCWNGSGCQTINTFYRITDQGFVCK